MKEATGELNMTVVTIVAIAAIAGFFALFWEKGIKPKIEKQWDNIDNTDINSKSNEFK